MCVYFNHGTYPNLDFGPVFTPRRCRKLVEEDQKRRDEESAKKQRMSEAVAERRAAMLAENEKLSAKVVLWRQVVAYITAPDTSGANKDPAMSWRHFFEGAFAGDPEQPQKVEALESPPCFLAADIPFIDVTIKASLHVEEMDKLVQKNESAINKLADKAGQRERAQERKEEAAKRRLERVQDPEHHEAHKNLVQFSSQNIQYRQHDKHNLLY